MQTVENNESAAGSKVFGLCLDSVRRRAKLNRTQFAERLGISRQHLWVLENGRQGVTPQRAARFARILGEDERQFVEAALQALIENAQLSFSVRLDAPGVSGASVRDVN